MYRIILILSLSILITNPANAQTINPNIKHDWEDSRYMVNANNTVTDTSTNLVWKKCSQGLSGSDCTIGSATAHNWQESLDIADTNTFAGFSDWRLPNIKELRSIAAYDRYNPSINSSIFPNTPSSYFWSSSPDANNAGDARILYFYFGYDDYSYRSNISHSVRLVRGGQ